MTGQGPRFDVKPFLNQDEGQHFDRKSLFHGPPGEKQLRDRREVRDQVARYGAGFANAEGGVLILGIEDDHSITPRRWRPCRRLPRRGYSPRNPLDFWFPLMGRNWWCSTCPAPTAQCR